MMLCTCNSIVFSYEQLLKTREQHYHSKINGNTNRSKQVFRQYPRLGSLAWYWKPGLPQVNHYHTPSLAGHAVSHHSTGIHAKPGASNNLVTRQHPNAGRQLIQQHRLTKLQGVCLRILASLCCRLHLKCLIWQRISKFLLAVYSQIPSVSLFLTWQVQRTSFLSNLTLCSI